LVRRDALESLRGSTDEATVAAVIDLFGKETDDAPLEKASQFLAQLEGKAEPAFLEGLKNPRTATRLKSISGLKSIKSDRGLEPVAQIFLGECLPEVRSACGDFLKSKGSAAEPWLLRGLENKDSEVRIASIRTLGEIESTKALEPVGRLFREDKNKEL